MCQFPSIQTAVDSAVGVLQCGIPVARIGEKITHMKKDFLKNVENFELKSFKWLFWIKFCSDTSFSPGAGGDLVAMKGPQGFSFFS